MAQTSFDFSAIKNKLVAGVDEVGRGPLAGPVVTAAVILDANHDIDGLTDSKLLTEKKRTELAAEIKHKAVAWSVARAEVHEIDKINILQASLLAMQRAVYQLSLRPEHVLVDGNKCPQLDIPVEAIVQGDKHVEVISAASIIAKVARDQEMIEMADRYPGYGFEKHKGYPTKQHMQALSDYGVTPIHRLSYGPVKKIIASNTEVLTSD